MDAGKLAKAVSGCQNLAQKFRAFSVVAEMLEDLGDVSKHCENLQREKSSLMNACNNLSASIEESRGQEKEAQQARDVAVANRDKELEVQEAVAEDILGKAKDEAKEIVKFATDSVELKKEAFEKLLVVARNKWSDMEFKVSEAAEKLRVLNEDIAAIKAKL